MNNLVTLQGESLTTTSLLIAEGLALQHKSVIQLIRQNQNDLEEFGPLTFEMRMGESLPQGGFAKATEYAVLNEHQATYLISSMRNSAKVKQFRKILVKQFYQMRDALYKRPKINNDTNMLFRINHPENLIYVDDRQPKPLVFFLDTYLMQRMRMSKVNYPELFAINLDHSISLSKSFKEACIKHNVKPTGKGIFVCNAKYKGKVNLYRLDHQFAINEAFDAYFSESCNKYLVKKGLIHDATELTLESIKTKLRLVHGG